MKIKLLLTLLIGLVSGGLLVSYIDDSRTSGGTENAKEPLYWVAPMDSSYRRDGPGKSPMGMDLVPVYEQGSQGDGPGVVRITPSVQHNTGVRTQLVQRKQPSVTVKTVGYVQYDEDKLVHIHPRVDGWIEALFVKTAGEPVEQGQALYSLYSPQLVNAQEEFLIAMRTQNKSLIEAATARLKSLQLSDAFVAKLKSQKTVQQKVVFYAPQSGVVAGLKIREGFYVQPGNTLMSIGQLDQVWVEAEVFERDAVFVKKGQDVTMTLDYLPGQQWLGKVDYVYPSLQSETRTLRVRLRFNNRDQLLKPNMFAKVQIESSISKPQLVVPTEAVIRTGKQNRVVVVLQPGQFKSVEVELGPVLERDTIVLSGLLEGDEVVTSAQFLIDSESSKSSDFTRMSALEAVSEFPRADVTGILNSIDAENRVINISRGPIEKWDRPAATMDFLVDDGVDISDLTAGRNVEFSFEVRDDLYIYAISMLEDAGSHHHPAH